MDQCELHVAGNIPTQAGTRNVVWHGPIEHRKVLNDLMPSCDVFVMPTRWDTFGMVLAEAAGAGLPAISTTLPGILDVIEHEVTGLLVAPDDADALANAIARLLSDPVLRQ